ncbi:MAG: hypothetical protein ACOX9A_06075 [Anaerolineae bacterium]|jgi:hypothetical protein
MKTIRAKTDRLFKNIRAHRRPLLIILLVCGVALSLSGFLALVSSPARRAGDALRMDAYGAPDVELSVTYPTRLGVEHRGADAGIITVWARALSPDAVAPLDLVLPLPDRSVAFVDLDGRHVPGRLQVIPGYPDALPYDLRVTHANTQYQAGPLFSHRVQIAPLLRRGNEPVPLPELAFVIRLESRWATATREFAISVATLGIPVLGMILVITLVVWLWRHLNRRQALRRERQLSGLYVELREQIRLQRWSEARARIDRLLMLEPGYRDVDQLDVLVSSAETAMWRREQLYNTGVRAYKNRDWPEAAQALRQVEQEAPYYRDVRFLRRTAELYADLSSRDRSLRIEAARTLGEVADLIDMMPLLRALGDRSNEVAEAAEAAFRRIGLDGLDVLLGGLSDASTTVQQRAYRLIKEAGQGARAALLDALRSNDVQSARPVARLLGELGAWQELAEALLWASPGQREGIIEALLGEGIVVTGVLVDLLLKAPPERQGLIIRVLAALKTRGAINRRIEEAMHGIRDSAQRELLQRALDAPAAPFDAGAEDEPVPVVEEDAAPAEKPRPAVRRLRLLDRRRS